MEDRIKPAVNLRELELETLEEAREWARERMKAKLLGMVQERGSISPPQRPAAAQYTDQAAEIQGVVRTDRT